MTRRGMCSKARCVFEWGKMWWRRAAGIGGVCAAGNGAYLLESGAGAGAVSAGDDANIYSLIQDIHAMTERSPAALRAVFEKHDSELVEE